MGTSGKDYILTVEEKRVSLIGNSKKISPEMTPYQRELEERQLKESKMWIKKRIEKEKKLLSYIGEKYMLNVLTGEVSKVYKRGA